jgi:malonyl-CoA/methylmalonyl-CoA synthetase
MTLFDLFEASARERSERTAINHLTYAELQHGVFRVLKQLQALGIGRGDRVALYCENRLGFVFSYLATLRLGAIAVPTNVLYRARDLEHVLSDAGAALVLVSAQTSDHLASLPSAYRSFEVDDVEAWAADPTLDSQEPATHIKEEDIATIIYTSGTTGRSKGAMMTHAQLAAISSGLALAWRWTCEDRLAVALPLFHVHGLCAALNTTLAVGAHLIVHERFDAQRMLQALRENGATMFFGVPTMYIRLLEALGEESPPRLRLWVSGSAPLSPEAFAEFAQRFGAEILERYGSTEFGFALSNRYAGPRIPGSVGVPLPGMRVRVAAVGETAALPPGEVGELLVAGPSVFAGYWKNPQATTAAFSMDAEGTRWYRSGDLSVFDSERDVYRIVGRMKELIISGGFNIYPREVEEEIDLFPGVLASAVVAKPDHARGEVPVAFVEAGENFDPAALLVHLRLRLASFKIPREVFIIDHLPRNALGKIEKHRLT